MEVNAWRDQQQDLIIFVNLSWIIYGEIVLPELFEVYQ